MPFCEWILSYGLIPRKVGSGVYTSYSDNSLKELSESRCALEPFGYLFEAGKELCEFGSKPGQATAHISEVIAEHGEKVRNYACTFW